MPDLRNALADNDYFVDLAGDLEPNVLQTIWNEKFCWGDGDLIVTPP